MIRSRSSFYVLNQASFLVSYRPATRAGLVHGLSRIGLAGPTTPWLRAMVNNLPVMYDEDYGEMAWWTVKFGSDIATHIRWVATVGIKVGSCQHGFTVLLPAPQFLLKRTMRLRWHSGARAWWLNIGNPEVPKDTWTNFRALITLRFGPLPCEGPHMHYRDPEIYRNMYMRRYVNNVTTWRAYPNESMSHYCQRLRDAMLPYIPQDRTMI
ncbi:hypothetical protein TIFTF001_032770 [Ficus carica]|uniref:Uncharacterized protein n=1 Tax=Ficus carica TaxID=3494 RepID=A0AA88J2U5_FICCA|nr:hypothetical protein TIFTF001_032770 [Ficus carica]